MRCSQVFRRARADFRFDAGAEQTQYLDTVLEFLEHYQVQLQRTRDFCAKLKEADLFEPMRAQFEFPSGEEGSLGGFLAVSRKRLKALSDEELAEMARTGALELVYLHLQSMHNFSRMVERMQGPAEDAVEPETAPSAADQSGLDAIAREAAVATRNDTDEDKGIH